VRHLQGARLEIDADPPVAARVEALHLAAGDHAALFVIDPLVWSR
jgi:hypothetical protein